MKGRRWSVFAIITMAWILVGALGLITSARSEVAQHRIIRVAVCQILCIDGDANANLRQIESALEAAAAEGADLASFPESIILGWVNPQAHALADPIPGPTTERLSELARRYRMMICIGMDEKDGEMLYDSAVLLGADGSLLLKQRKIDNLRRLNLLDPPYSDGTVEDLRTVDTPAGRIGVLICADSFDEALMRRMAEDSADVVLAPLGWAAEAGRWPRHGQTLAKLMAQGARWAGCPVIGVNRVGTIAHGPWAGRIYGGQSVVADAEGTILAVLRDRDVEVRVVEVRLGNKRPEE